MTDSHHDAHARFRFSVIGPLLSAPPGQGELRVALRDLAARTWKHPITGEATRYGFSTNERWYYLARDAQNPVDALRRAIRSDTGRRRERSTPATLTGLVSSTTTTSGSPSRTTRLSALCHPIRVSCAT